MKYLKKRIKYYKSVISEYNIKINKLKNNDNKICSVEMKVKRIESKFRELNISNLLKVNEEYIYLKENLNKLKQISNQFLLLELKKSECEKQKNKLQIELDNLKILTLTEKKYVKTKVNTIQKSSKKCLARKEKVMRFKNASGGSLEFLTSSTSIWSVKKK